MRRLLLASLLVCPALISAAEPAGTPETKPIANVNPVVATAATAGPAAPRPMQLVSPATAARLTAGVPKYLPPAAAPTQPASPVGVTAPDLRETDRPRNTILRLPEYVVREDKLVIPQEREVLTPRGKLDRALKRHPGLRFGSFWIFRNDRIALIMLAEEERLERKREFEDLASLMRFTDPPAAQEMVKREVQKGFMREPDFGR